MSKTKECQTLSSPCYVAKTLSLMVPLMPIFHANQPTLQTEVQDTGELDRQDGPNTLAERGENLPFLS